MDALLSPLEGMHPALQALVATLFTWAVTALGASLVFFFRRVNQKILDAMMGFAAGVMIAASFWSLLAEAASFRGAQHVGQRVADRRLSSCPLERS